MIDRQGVRDHLNDVRGFSGVIGTINCDDFGDCGAAKITVVQNIGARRRRGQPQQRGLLLRAVS